MPKPYTKWSERTKRRNFKWTAEAIKTLRSWDGIISDHRIGLMLGCTRWAVINKRKDLKNHTSIEPVVIDQDARVARMVYLTERIGLCNAYLKRNPLQSAGVQS